MKLLQNLISSGIQLLLGYFCIPLLACLLGLFSDNNWAEDLVTFIVALATDVPVIGTMVDAITLFLNNYGSELSRLRFVTSILSISGTDMAAACSIGMWSGICFKFGKLLGLKGLPVLQSLAAVIVSSALSKYISAYADPLFLLLLVIFSATLNIVLTILVADPNSKFMAVVFGIGCEVAVGVFAAAYAAFLILVMLGLIPSLGLWIAIELCLVIPMCVFLVIDYLLV